VIRKWNEGANPSGRSILRGSEVDRKSAPCEPQTKFHVNVVKRVDSSSRKLGQVAQGHWRDRLEPHLLALAPSIVPGMRLTSFLLGAANGIKDLISRIQRDCLQAHRFLIIRHPRDQFRWNG
jgi:hypothetical protein